MRALSISLALSLCLHAGGAVWLSRSLGADDGGETGNLQTEAQFAFASGDAVAALIETWDTPPGAVTGVASLPPGPEEGPHFEAPRLTVDELPVSDLAEMPVRPVEDPAPRQPRFDTENLPQIDMQAIAKLHSPTATEGYSRPDVLEASAIGMAPPPPELPLNDMQPSSQAPPVTSIMAVARPEQRPARTSATQAAMTSAAIPAAPAKGTGRQSERPGDRNEWGNAIRLSISRHHRVPNAALRRGLSGRVVLRVTVMPDGAVAGMAIRASSGHNLLDNAAVATLRRAGRLPQAPAGISAPMTFDVPLAFQTG